MPGARRAAICLLLLLTGCRRRPNLLVVTFDTTRADRVGYASGRTGVTPALDRLAAEGVWFSSAVTAAPMTLPSHATIFTGLYPFHHRVRDNGSFTLPDSAVTLAEVLRDRGYRTHAVVSSFVLDHRFGLAQGFDGYQDETGAAGGSSYRETTAAETARRAIEWLDEAPRRKPFFLWLHFFDPHAPYRPPADIARRFPDDPYQGEIAYADRELGRVLAELDRIGRRRDTVVVFTADHGEGLGEHRERTHDLFVYDSTARVPLLVCGPGVPAGRRIDVNVRTVDIFPTATDLLGIPATETDGRSLRAAWQGAVVWPPAYLETFATRLDYGWSELRAMRNGRWKVIAAPRPELYDLQEDPHETRNLYGGAIPPDARSLDAELRRIESADPAGAAAAGSKPPDEETARRLSALGYVSSQSRATALPDPKDRVNLWNRYQDAASLLSRGDFDAAVSGLKDLLRDDPQYLDALNAAATAEIRRGRPKEALPYLERAYALEPRADTADLIGRLRRAGSGPILRR